LERLGLRNDLDRAVASAPIYIPDELPVAVGEALSRVVARARLAAAADPGSAESQEADRILIGLYHRPKDPPITFALPDGGLEEQARGILAAVSRGEVNVADGRALLSSVKDAAALDALREKVEALERNSRPPLRRV
jgi:hypothetical protein